MTCRHENQPLMIYTGLLACTCEPDCICRATTCVPTKTSCGGFTPPPETLFTADGPITIRKHDNVAIPLPHGSLRVKVEERPGFPQFGVLLGLLLDEHGDTQAVVRLDHYGLMLKALHPSKVTAVSPEEEAAHKP